MIIGMLLSTAFLAGAPGPFELAIIFVVILVLFGPKRLPQIARMVGKTLDELRHASQDFRDQIMHIEEPPTLDVDAAHVAAEKPGRDATLQSSETAAENDDTSDIMKGTDWAPTDLSDDVTAEDGLAAPEKVDAEPSPTVLRDPDTIVEGEHVEDRPDVLRD